MRESILQLEQKLHADPPKKKLNVLFLHGTTMCGKEMRNMFRWKECNVEHACKDIANFYYPSGPCEIHKDHVFWKSVPHHLLPGPDKLHWFTMTTKRDFSDFEAARRSS
mmetsp:Transcript_21048/g.29679  ORF Transcript_21048/g.29679 Transcript_21048/m.29679 type:complete len:109 (+) Transcript_21048:82-408(+)